MMLLKGGSQFSTLWVSEPKRTCGTSNVHCPAAACGLQERRSSTHEVSSHEFN